MTIDGRNVAFLPHPLPERYEVPPAATTLYADAREIIGELRGIGRTLPDHQLLTRPLRQREALRSSSLEGTYATPEELIAFEQNPRDPDSSTDPANSWLEVFNYQKALDIGQRLVTEGYPFSPWLIRQMHEALLTGVRGEDKSPGNVRSTQVHIGAGNRFTPPPAEHLPSLIDQFEKDVVKTAGMDPLIHCFLVHYQFETIHPFRDGNGRVGRLLLALMIYRCCGFDMPWLYLSEFFERHKDEYIDNLFAVSTESAWDRWVTFCLRATIDVGRSTIKRIGQLLDIRASYEARIRAMNGRDRLIHVVPTLFSSPMLRYSDLRETLGTSYPTARGDMDALEEAGIVSVLNPNANPKVFVAREIFRVAYYDDPDEPVAVAKDDTPPAPPSFAEQPTFL